MNGDASALDRVDIGGEHEDAHGGRDTPRQVAAQFAGEGVALLGGVEDVPHRKNAWASPPLRDGAAAGERLDAAVLAAAAERAVRVDGDVPHLARGPARAPPQLTVGDDARGDSGPEVEVAHRARTAVQRVRAEGGGLDVVLHAYRHTERRLDCGGQVQLVDAEVHRMDDSRRARLNLSGDADADRPDRGDIDAGVDRERAHRIEDRFGDGIRSPARREPYPADDRSGRIDGDGVGLRAADVEPDLHRPASPWKAAGSCANISP
jgi:hypothetical protein